MPIKFTFIAPENGRLEYFLVSFWGPAYFQGLLLLVLGSVLLGMLDFIDQ